mgnify:CR=1 FL=1
MTLWLRHARVLATMDDASREIADGSVLVAIVTHEGPERCVAQALERLSGSPSLTGAPLWMHILG